MSAQSIIFKFLNKFFKLSALSLVLLLMVISEAFILFKAKIIDGTTPPAPNIKIFLPATSIFEFLIPSSNPPISVLWPTTISLSK